MPLLHNIVNGLFSFQEYNCTSTYIPLLSVQKKRHKEDRFCKSTPTAVRNSEIPAVHFPMLIILMTYDNLINEGDEVLRHIDVFSSRV